MESKVILYIAISEDGYIAGEGDNLDFLNTVQIEGEDYGYAQFISSVDTVLVGRKTFDKVISMGYPYHPDKEVYVITRSKGTSDKACLHFYNQDLVALMSTLKKSTQKNIFCDGGAELAKHLIELNQIDQIILSVVPLKLKSGTSLFKNGCVPENFKLVNSVVFKSGLIQRLYLRAV